MHKAARLYMRKIVGVDFFKGSVQAAAANTNIPSSIKLLKNEMKLSEMKPLSATEKLHMQSLIRQNLKMKSIR